MTVPRPERIPEFMLEAFRIANSGRRGPVVVNIPRDLFNHDIDVRRPGAGGGEPMAAPTADRAALAEMKQLILAAKAPVIHAGAGIKWGRASEKLARARREAAASRSPIPPGHADIVPMDHPLYAGGVGPRGNPVASALMREADLVLALGTRLGFNTTFYKYNDISTDGEDRAGRHRPRRARAAISRWRWAIAADAGAVATRWPRCMDAVRRPAAPWRARNEQIPQGPPASCCGSAKPRAAATPNRCIPT